MRHNIAQTPNLIFLISFSLISLYPFHIIIAIWHLQSVTSRINSWVALLTRTSLCQVIQTLGSCKTVEVTNWELELSRKATPGDTSNIGKAYILSLKHLMHNINIQLEPKIWKEQSIIENWLQLCKPIPMVRHNLGRFV